MCAKKALVRDSCHSYLNHRGFVLMPLQCRLRCFVIFMERVVSVRELNSDERLCEIL